MQTSMLHAQTHNNFFVLKIPGMPNHLLILLNKLSSWLILIHALHLSFEGSFLISWLIYVYQFYRACVVES